MKTTLGSVLRLSDLMLTAILVATSQLLAQTPRDFAVDLGATVSTSAPCITLSWTIRRQGNITAQKVHRRLKGENVWAKQADLATNQTGYVDNTAVPGVEYEYWMERTYSVISPVTAMGYLSSGVNVPMAESRGKLLLVVDSTMVSPLAPEIAQLQGDLSGDGWLVQTITATRSDSAVNVKALIKAAYDADTNNVKMVYLLGHVPVPYSGDTAPDGHDNHVGAWPADGYYGDMNGIWTDTSVNDSSAGDVRNRNIPGDSKFDQSYFPVPLKLMVGRVDLSNMTCAPAATVSETSLLRRYLHKAHDFRFKQGVYAAIPRRCLVRDGFGYFGGENSAIVGWDWFFSGVTATQIDEPPSDQWFSASYAGGKSYLVGCGNGGGSWDSASGIGYSVDFGLKTSRVVFTTLFGSLFGDWDSANNFMRAPLAGNATGDSLGLTCFWGSRPNVFMHPMGLGETAGYCVWISQNGSLTGGGNYQPNSSAGVHTGLMGDPALRLHTVEPPRNLAASSANTRVTLAWTPSSETNLLGYLVYRAGTAAGPFTRLTASPQAATTYTDATVTASQSYTYLVRTLKLETAPGGTYQNPSVGSPVTLTANAGGAAAPFNPTSLTVAQNSAANAQLTWVDNASTETGFRIERKTNAGGTFASVGTVGASVTNFTDTGVFTQGNVYYYRVVATGSPSDSVPSPEASFEAFAGFFDLPVTRVKVNKTVGTVLITVNRFGGVTGPVSVNYATTNSSATAGTHYTATNGVLAWADGEAGSKTVSVPVINTATPQAARQFKVTLSSPSAGAALTLNSSIAVLIEDPTATLAAPWSQTILSGSITDSSSATLVNGEFGSVTVGGAGVASGSTYEAGRFIYQSRTGDGVMTAYFPAGLPSDGNARVALMARASTANTAVMAAAATSASASFGSLLSTRTTDSGGTTVLPASANNLTLARWMRLSRAGNVFTAATSAGGSAWTMLGTATLDSMPSTALWGIFHFSSDWSVTGLGSYQLATAQYLTVSDLPIPATPTGLVAVATSPVSIALTWGSVTNAAGYLIERGSETDSFTPLFDMASGAGTTQTFTDTNLVADTAYTYRVTAYNSTGSSGSSAIAYVASPPADMTTVLTTDGAGCADATVRLDFPSVPLGTQTNLTVAGADPDTWDVLASAAKTYLRFDLTGVGSFTTAKLKLAYVGASRFEDAGYYNLYMALFGDSSDTWSESSITWNNAPQNSLTGVGFTGSFVGIGDGLNHFDLPAPGDVVSFDLAATILNSSRGSNNLVTIGIAEYSAGAITEWASREHPSYAPPTLELSVSSPLPCRPSFFSATLGTGWRVALAWHDNATNETGYALERREWSGDFTPLFTLAANTVGFVDTNIASSTTYEYRLRAVNASGNSSWSSVASVTTPDFFHGLGMFWDAGGSDTFINTPSNWDTDTNPAFDGSGYLVFGSAGGTATVNTNVSFRGMCIYRDTDFTFAVGGGTLSLGAGGLWASVSNSTPRTYRVAAPVALAANQAWGVTNFGAGVTTLIVSGPVTDGDSVFGITKSGDGVLTLAGNSGYDGPTVVATGGVLRVAHANALGSTNGATTVMNGGWLEVTGSVTVAESLTLNGDAAVGGAGTLRSTSGTNVWTGAVTLGSAARVRALSGSELTLSGGVTGSATLYLVPDANAGLRVSGLPLKVGSSNIYANGAGTVVLGATGSTWGTLEAAGLTVRTDVANALPAASILSLGSSFSPNGVVDLNGNSQTVAQLKRGTTTAGARLVTSATPATLTVNGSASLTFDGWLTGALGLAYYGTSASMTLTLAGTNNTYTGSTTVGSGTLTLSSGSNLGNSTNITVAGGTLTVSAGASLGTCTNVTVAGGTLRLLSVNGIADAATLRIADGGAKVYLNAGVTDAVDTLILGQSRKTKGTWGSTASGADHKDDTHFSGTGVINVPNGNSSSTLWDGGAATTYASDPMNWDYDELPLLNGTGYITFGTAGSEAVVNTNLSFLGVRLNRDANFILANGGGTLTLGAGGFWAQAASATSVTYTVAANTVLAADQNWGVTNNGAGVTALLVTGGIADGSSSFGIAKSGSGVLTLAGDNSFDGPVSVATGGVLRVAHNNGLGSTNGITTVASNAWLEIGGSVSVPEPLTVGDSGAAGALRSTEGTNAWRGRLTLAATARLVALTGSRLVLSGGVSGAFDLLLSPAAGAEIEVGGAVTNGSARKVAAEGPGSVLLGGAGHTFGTLEVGGGALVRVASSNAVAASLILSIGTAYGTKGTFDLNGYSVTVSQLKRSNTSAGTRLVTSAAPAVLTVSGSTSTTYDGLLTGALSLVKAGASTLTLIGTNTYSGATVVSNGTLYISAGASLRGSLDVTVAGGTLSVQTSTDGLADAATLRIADGGGAKVYVKAGAVETVGALYLGGVRARRGTWGASGSVANHTDSTHFSGSGVIFVSHGPETVFLVR